MRAGQRLRADTAQERLLEPADEGVQRGDARLHPARRERQAVAVGEPEQRDHRREHEALHQHGERVLGADQPAVEERQARDGHEEHQRGGAEHPGRVATVERRDGVLGEGGGGCGEPHCGDQQGPGGAAKARRHAVSPVARSGLPRASRGSGRRISISRSGPFQARIASEARSEPEASEVHQALSGAILRLSRAAGSRARSRRGIRARRGISSSRR